jgi:hypothetical protein
VHSLAGLGFLRASSVDVCPVFTTTDQKKTGVAGLSTDSSSLIDTAYDVLGLEAVFLVPRIFSLLSLNPYFGTLVSTEQLGQV